MELLSDMLQAVNPAHREVCVMVAFTFPLVKRGAKSLICNAAHLFIGCKR